MFFDNTACLACGAALGYEPNQGQIHALTPAAQLDIWRGGSSGTNYKRCLNFASVGCNWVIPATDPNDFCRACRLNHAIPKHGTYRFLSVRVVGRHYTKAFLHPLPGDKESHLELVPDEPNHQNAGRNPKEPTDSVFHGVAPFVTAMIMGRKAGLHGAC